MMKQRITIALVTLSLFFSQSAWAVNDGGTGTPAPQDGSSVMTELWYWLASQWPW